MIKTAIVEDNERYKDLIKTILAGSDKIMLIHESRQAFDLVSEFKKEKPDVVILDIDLPGKNGIEALWELKIKWPEIKVLMLTVFEDDDKIFGAIKAGANGYLLKKDSPQKILDAVEAVYKGDSPMNGMIAAKVLDYFKTVHKKNNFLQEANLTDREKEILQLLIEGMTYKQLSARIFISVETLNSHVKNIYRKLNVHSRSELAAKFGNI